MRPVCRMYTGDRGLEKGHRVEEWNYQRFRDNKLQRVLVRLILIFTSCKEVNFKCEFWNKQFIIFFETPCSIFSPRNIELMWLL